METIARIRTDFPSKFGIPRQSGLVKELKGTVIFEPKYRNPDAIRGLEGFSHIWLIWEFDNTDRGEWSPTVRPPKLGGNTRMGVFATRSPFRPNPIGMSSVRLEAIEETPNNGTVLRVSGADMADGTRILDIKPYVPYSDCHTDATGGFSKDSTAPKLAVNMPEELKNKFPKDKLDTLIKILELDPRPAYKEESDRVYGFGFANHEIKFTVENNTVNVKEIL